jgi:threonine efflux protein
MWLERKGGGLRVTLFFAIPLVHRGYARIRRRVDAVMGGILILLGGRLLVSR